MAVGGEYAGKLVIREGEQVLRLRGQQLRGPVWGQLRSKLKFVRRFLTNQRVSRLGGLGFA